MFKVEGINPIGVQLTGGDNERREGRTYFVSKSHLVGKFLAAWDSGRIKIPLKASFFGLFSNELKAFRGEMSKQGRAKFEAAEGEHDDLVMAVAQAIWVGESQVRTIGIPEITESIMGGGPRWDDWWAPDGILSPKQWMVRRRMYNEMIGGQFRR